jgi:hypothetical protein
MGRPGGTQRLSYQYHQHYDRRASNLAMYLKLNCQHRERRQSIQDVARPKNSRGVIDRRRRSGVSREGAKRSQRHSTQERLSSDRRTSNLAMYLKLNCQHRERQQSIQDVARPRNRKGVIDRRRRSGVSREGAKRSQRHSTQERLSSDRRTLNLAMYLKLNCQNRERQQSIQDVARPRNSKRVID